MMPDLLNRFRAIISDHSLLSKEKQYILALSGGLDSMVLFTLLKGLDYDIIAAHVNYHLRSEESDANELLVRRFCKSHDVVLKVLNISELSRNPGDNLQEWARNTRYRYFESLRKIYKAEAILTAHHANDQAETLLLNMMRGSGLSGMEGMQIRKGVIMRPLLSFSRTELEEYAHENKLPIAVDSSNFDAKYKRNYLRNVIFPLLYERFPDPIKSLAKVANNLQQSSRWIALMSQEFLDEHLVAESNLTYIARSHLQDHPDPYSILSLWLKKLSVPAWILSAIIDDLRQKRNGIEYVWNANRIDLERERLCLRELVHQSTHVSLRLDAIGSYKLNKHTIRISRTKKPQNLNAGKYTVYLTSIRPFWPLQIRSWREGDRIQVLGMRGKKKISDILIDNKVEKWQKEKTLVFEHDGEILWLPGHCQSEKYKVIPEEEEVYKIEFEQE